MVNPKIYFLKVSKQKSKGQNMEIYLEPATWTLKYSQTWNNAAFKPFKIKPDLYVIHATQISRQYQALISGSSSSTVKSEREHPLFPQAGRTRRNFCQQEVQYY